MTPLLTRIDRQLQSTSDSDKRAELLAERACYMARIGDLAGAKSIIDALRGSHGSGRSARVSVWIMLAEGVSRYFENLSDQAHGRVLRASELSRALGIEDLAGLSAAWLAHLELDRSNYAQMARVAERALDSSRSWTHDLNVRIGLVLGDAHLHAGDRARSQIWYRWARANALSAGDRASVGALMYNRASFGLAWYRVSQFSHIESTHNESPSLLALEIESSCGFQRATGVTALTYLSDLWLARARLLMGEYKFAYDTLTIISTSVQEEDRSARTPLLGDLANCLGGMRRFGELRQLISNVNRESYEALDADDRVVFLGSIIDAASLMPDSKMSAELIYDFESAREAYRSELSGLRSALRAFLSVMPDES